MITHCNVVGCGYIAESTFADLGDFPVCSLHDAQVVHDLVAAFVRPGAWWCFGQPIVMPAGELTEVDLTPREVRPTDLTARLGDTRATTIYAGEDQRLATVKPRPGQIFPAFDVVVSARPATRGT